MVSINRIRGGLPVNELGKNSDLYPNGHLARKMEIRETRRQRPHRLGSLMTLIMPLDAIMPLDVSWCLHLFINICVHTKTHTAHSQSLTRFVPL